jgi:dephospho-CoA kinase
MFIGITGLAGSGKGTVADILSEIVINNGVLVRRYNLSDEIKAELIRRGRLGDCDSRTKLIETGNELRDTFGDGILARRILAREEKVLTEKPGNHTLVLITGIRNPGEVHILRDAWGDQFLLLAIELPENMRRERLMSRTQYLDDDISLSEEIDKADQDIGITKCIAMADRHLSNSGTSEKLRLDLQEFVNNEILDRLHRDNE